jgi:hypothetical protein
MWISVATANPTITISNKRSTTRKRNGGIDGPLALLSCEVASSLENHRCDAARQPSTSATVSGELIAKRSAGS